MLRKSIRRITGEGGKSHSRDNSSSREQQQQQVQQQPQQYLRPQPPNQLSTRRLPLQQEQLSYNNVCHFTLHGSGGLNNGCTLAVNGGGPNNLCHSPLQMSHSTCGLVTTSCCNGYPKQQQQQQFCQQEETPKKKNFEIIEYCKKIVHNQY